MMHVICVQRGSLSLIRLVLCSKSRADGVSFSPNVIDSRLLTSGSIRNNEHSVQTHSMPRLFSNHTNLKKKKALEGLLLFLFLVKPDITTSLMRCRVDREKKHYGCQINASVCVCQGFWPKCHTL